MEESSSSEDLDDDAPVMDYVRGAAMPAAVTEVEPGVDLEFDPGHTDEVVVGNMHIEAHHSQSRRSAQHVHDVESS